MKFIKTNGYQIRAVNIKPGFFSCILSLHDLLPILEYLIGILSLTLSTIYFRPSGQIKVGSMISDWDDPARTKLIIGYRGPYKLHKTGSAYQFAGIKYKDRKTIYYLPLKKLLAGDKINNFKRLPKNTLIFLPNTL